MTKESQKSVYYRPSNTSAADRNCIPPSDSSRRIAYLKAVSKLWMSAMNAISLTFAVALAACSPSPKESAMPSPSSESGTTAPANGTKQQAAVAPPQVALEGIPLAAPPAHLSAEAEGRRTLSTAFVRVGPDGHLTVELRDGRVLVLRNVVMRAKDYCGVQVSGGAAGAKYCGGYAEVAAARPGGGPTGSELPEVVSRPIKS